MRGNSCSDDVAGDAPVPVRAGTIWRIACPLIVSMGSQSLMMFFDRLFLGWFSETSLRAALPAGVLAFTVQSGFFALAGYAGTFVSQYHGAGDRAGCARAAGQGLIVALMAWPLVAALIPASDWVLRLSRHGPEVLAEELAYSRILLWGSLPTLVSSAAAGFFSGRGDTRTTMWAYLVGNIANIVLDYWFIFGGLGLPACGIRGAAWATVIGGGVPCLLLLGRLYGPRMNLEFQTRRHLRPDGKLLVRLVRFGLPSGVHLQLDLIAFAVFVLLTGRYGAVEQTANSVALSVNALAFMPVIGFGVAAGIVVGQRQGCGDSAGAMRAGWVSLAMGASYMAAVGLTFALFPHFYTRLFVGAAGTAPQTDSVYPVARLLLLWVAGWSLGDACNLVLAGALKGAGDTRFVMRFSLFCNWVLFLGGLVAIRVFRCGGFQVMWLWATVNVWIMAAGYVWRFMGGRWQNIDLLGRSEPELLPPPAQPCAAMVRDP